MPRPTPTRKIASRAPTNTHLPGAAGQSFHRHQEHRIMATRKPKAETVKLSPLEAVLALPLEHLDLEQGSRQWHEVRVLGRPASETACIMGVSPYAKPFEIWQRKTGVEKKQFEHAGLRRGKDEEAAVRDAYEARTGISLEPLVLRRGNYIASTDGIDMFGKRVGEIKITTVDAPLFQYVRNGELPEYYDWQCQQQLMVSGAEVNDFFVRVEQRNSQGSMVHVEDILIEVKPDRAKWEQIVSAWDAFWVFVDSMEPPESGEYDHTKDEALIAAEAEMVRLIGEGKRIEELVAAQRAILDAACTEQGKHVFALGSLRRGFKKGNVDYKAVPELTGVNLELYRKAPSKTSTYRANAEGGDDAAE
jgi:putative phage-type endonuclease